MRASYEVVPRVTIANRQNLVAAKNGLGRPQNRS
jgi:hypothetical protein